MSVLLFFFWGWPEMVFPRLARGAARKKVSVLTGIDPRCNTQIWLEWPWAGLARTDFSQAGARRGAQKSSRFDREWIWVETAC